MTISGETRFRQLRNLKALGANLSEDQIADALGVALMSQAEAEAGTGTGIRFMTAERLKQAIAALEAGAGAATDTANFDGILSAADDTVQKALDTLDDYTPSIASATESSEGAVEQATDAEVRASTAGAKAVMAEDLKTAAAVVALSDAATIALDWSSGINFEVTLTANRTLGNPTNEVQGQWRTVLVKGNDASARTLSFDTEYGGTPPSLTDITSTKFYLISIYCKDASKFLASAIDGSD
jgi:hypothetical protein